MHIIIILNAYVHTHMQSFGKVSNGYGEGYNICHGRTIIYPRVSGVGLHISSRIPNNP